MNKLPIALALFSSTRGHYGHKTIYQTTINELALRAPLGLFESLNVHIKRSGDDNDAFESMSKWFTDKGFNVISSSGEWKHHHPSHFVEHGKDIGRILTDNTIQKSQYIMWLEDDVVLTGDDIGRQLAQAVDHLKERPLTVAVRWLDYSQGTETLLNIHQVTPDIIIHRDVFSFRVSVLRSRDARVLGRHFIVNYPENMGTHIERYATEILRFISGADYPFAAFDKAVGRHIHIGSPEYSRGWVEGLVNSSILT
jgi:hypothetical protein